jgi:hypothetical protein
MQQRSGSLWTSEVKSILLYKSTFVHQDDLQQNIHFVCPLSLFDFSRTFPFSREIQEFEARKRVAYSDSNFCQPSCLKEACSSSPITG